ncbi:MAG: hypothetical protein HYV02_04940 [Deltaproteobacteria bacterium]|nr:hypothetical protein [Deltaproteobacteria bacterium]
MADFRIERFRAFEKADVADGTRDFQVTPQHASEIGIETSDAFTAVDLNGDGRIHFTEWVTATSHDTTVHQLVGRLFSDETLKDLSARAKPVGVHGEYQTIFLLFAPFFFQGAIPDFSQIVEKYRQFSGAFRLLGMSDDEIFALALEYRPMDQMAHFPPTAAFLQFSHLLTELGLSSPSAQSAFMRSLPLADFTAKDFERLFRNAEVLVALLREIGFTNHEILSTVSIALMHRGTVDTIDNLSDGIKKMREVLPDRDIAHFLHAATESALQGEEAALSLFSKDLPAAVDAISALGITDTLLRMTLFEDLASYAHPEDIIATIPAMVETLKGLDCIPAEKQGDWFRMLTMKKTTEHDRVDPFASLPKIKDWLNNAPASRERQRDLLFHAFDAGLDFEQFAALDTMLMDFGIPLENRWSLLFEVFEDNPHMHISAAKDAATIVQNMHLSDTEKGDLIVSLFRSSLYDRRRLHSTRGLLLKMRITPADGDRYMYETITRHASKEKDPLSLLDMGLHMLDTLGLAPLPWKEAAAELDTIVETNMGAIDYGSGIERFNTLFSPTLRREFYSRLGGGGIGQMVKLLQHSDEDDMKKISPEALLELSARLRTEKGLHYFGRVSIAVARELLAKNVPEKPTALFATAYDDWNGAFYWDHQQMKAASDAGYNIDLLETRSEETLYRHFQQLPDASLDLLVISGHGKASRITLGSAANSNADEEGAIDFGDLYDEGWKIVAKKLKPESVVILTACSAGRGGVAPDDAPLENILTFFRRIFRGVPGITIYAPPVSVFSELDFEHGRGVPRYQKGLEEIPPEISSPE